MLKDFRSSCLSCQHLPKLVVGIIASDPWRPGKLPRPHSWSYCGYLGIIPGLQGACVPLFLLLSLLAPFVTPTVGSRELTRPSNGLWFHCILTRIKNGKPLARMAGVGAIFSEKCWMYWGSNSKLYTIITRMIWTFSYFVGYTFPRWFVSLVR